jgi:hypothetical protein
MATNTSRSTTTHSSSPKRNLSVVSKKSNDVSMLIGGVSFAIGFFLGSGRTEIVSRTGVNLLEHMGRMLADSFVESLKKKSGSVNLIGARS